MSLHFLLCILLSSVSVLFRKTLFKENDRIKSNDMEVLEDGYGIDASANQRFCNQP